MNYFILLRGISSYLLSPLINSFAYKHYIITPFNHHYLLYLGLLVLVLCDVSSLITYLALQSATFQIGWIYPKVASLIFPLPHCTIAWPVYSWFHSFISLPRDTFVHIKYLKMSFSFTLNSLVVRGKWVSVHVISLAIIAGNTNGIITILGGHMR